MQIFSCIQYEILCDTNGNLTNIKKKYGSRNVQMQEIRKECWFSSRTKFLAKSDTVGFWKNWKYIQKTTSKFFSFLHRKVLIIIKMISKCVWNIKHALVASFGKIELTISRILSVKGGRQCRMKAFLFEQRTERKRPAYQTKTIHFASRQFVANALFRSQSGVDCLRLEFRVVGGSGISFPTWDWCRDPWHFDMTKSFSSRLLNF